MLQIILSIVIPVALVFTACVQYGTATPALVVGGIAAVVLVVSTFLIRKAEHFEVGIAWVFFVTLPAFVVAVILLGGSGIYHLVQHVGS